MTDQAAPPQDAAAQQQRTAAERKADRKARRQFLALEEAQIERGTMRLAVAYARRMVIASPECDEYERRVVARDVSGLDALGATWAIDSAAQAAAMGVYLARHLPKVSKKLLRRARNTSTDMTTGLQPPDGPTF